MTSRRTLAAVLLAAAVSLSLFAAGAKKDKKSSVPQMSEQQRALHALNRLTFGPRPGDVERVLKTGVDKWIEQQLHPEKINDSALAQRLAGLRTLKMDTRTMLEDFPPPQVIKAVADGRLPLPSDPTKRAIYTAQIEQYRLRQQNQAANQGATAPADMPDDQDRAARRAARMSAELQAESIIQLPPKKRMEEILKLGPEDRRALVTGLDPAERATLFDALTPEERETLLALVNPQLVVTSELQEGKLLRAAYSERQLEEVMTDFWFNHFNVFMGKGADRYLITSYERDVIRPHALGKFQDLLMATAQSPAMLFYLDNWMSVGPESDFALNGGRRAQRQARAPRPRRAARPVYGPFPGRRRYPPIYMPPAPRPQRQPRPAQRQPQPAPQQRRGLNENYARELMELHTVGVNGGYTQADVTEVARILTGWTLKEPRRGGEFDFDKTMHEPGDKIVMGHTFKNHGEDEGKQLLVFLAHRPATARFISTKLAQRFVSDNPPESLINRMADTFTHSDGDIREVLRTMFRAPEFWAPEAYRAKVKTPLEFVVSAVRAGAADINFAMPLVQALNRMGMPLYGAQPPTGYSTKADTWVNSAALLNRMNFALAFANGRLPGANFNAAQVLGSSAPPSDGDRALAQLEHAILAGDISKQTHETILKQLNDPQVTGRALDDAARPVNVGVLAGLILGSPEFQRR
jgi:uncharacterized protein (DUF1800 family)